MNLMFYTTMVILLLNGSNARMLIKNASVTNTNNTNIMTPTVSSLIGSDPHTWTPHNNSINMSDCNYTHNVNNVNNDVSFIIYSVDKDAETLPYTIQYFVNLIIPQKKSSVKTFSRKARL